jgi:hypothetical protein
VIIGLLRADGTGDAGEAGVEEKWDRGIRSSLFCSKVHRLQLRTAFYVSLSKVCSSGGRAVVGTEVLQRARDRKRAMVRIRDILSGFTKAVSVRAAYMPFVHLWLHALCVTSLL